MLAPMPTATMRREYADALCALSPGGDRTQVATFRVYGWPRDLWVIREGVAAFEALSSIFEKYRYPFEESAGGTLVCRPITGGTLYSAHAHGIALDINPSRNPYVEYTGQPRSTWTDMSPAMIADVKAIRTAKSNRQVFVWGGDWTTVKDAMHFQIGAYKSELAEGLIVPGGTTPIPDEGTEMLCAKGDRGPVVESLQRLLVNAGTTKIPASGIDGVYGSGTQAALAEVVGNTDGAQYGPHEYAALLERRLAQIVTGSSGMTQAAADSRYAAKGARPVRHWHAIGDTAVEEGKIIPPDRTGKVVH